MYDSDVGALTAAEHALRAFGSLLDAAGLTASEAKQRLIGVAACQRLLSAASAKLAARVRDSYAHHVDGDRDPADTCAKALGIERSEANRLVQLADKTAALPLVDAAFAAGSL